MVRVFVRELRRYPADLINIQTIFSARKKCNTTTKREIQKTCFKTSFVLLWYPARAALSVFRVYICCISFPFNTCVLVLVIMCIILFSRNEKKTFLSKQGKKRGKFMCILQSDVDKLRTHTRALDDEEVKEDKEEELEDVLHHHQNCRSYSFFASKRER